MNWLILTLITLGVVVLIGYRVEADTIFDPSVLFGVIPYLLAQLAFYFQTRRLLKWLAVILISFTLLAIALSIVLTSTSTVTADIKGALTIVTLSAIPLIINLMALLRISASKQLHRNTEAPGATGEP